MTLADLSLVLDSIFDSASEIKSALWQTLLLIICSGKQNTGKPVFSYIPSSQAGILRGNAVQAVGHSLSILQVISMKHFQYFKVSA